MPLGILRLGVIAAAALLPAYLRVDAFVLPVTSARGISSSVGGSSSRRAASVPSTATAVAGSVEEAKSNLKRALVENKGSTLAKDVAAAVEVGLCRGKLCGLFARTAAYRQNMYVLVSYIHVSITLCCCCCRSFRLMTHTYICASPRTIRRVYLISYTGSGSTAAAVLSC